MYSRPLENQRSINDYQSHQTSCKNAKMHFISTKYTHANSDVCSIFYHEILILLLIEKAYQMFFLCVAKRFYLAAYIRFFTYFKIMITLHFAHKK